jgi:hypothetical protein
MGRGGTLSAASRPTVQLTAPRKNASEPGVRDPRVRDHVAGAEDDDPAAGHAEGQVAAHGHALRGDGDPEAVGGVHLGQALDVDARA